MTIQDLLNNYEAFLPPPDENPVLVKVGLDSIDFSDISVLNMEFSIFYYLRLLWTDSRLKFNLV